MLGDVLTPQDREETLHAYAEFPDDLVSLRVDDVECFADNDIEVYSKADGSAITLRHDVFFLRRRLSTTRSALAGRSQQFCRHGTYRRRTTSMRSRCCWWWSRLPR